MEAVIQWHETGLVPLGDPLTGDPRCRLVQGDFFDLSRNPAQGFDPETPGRKFDAVLLDIDHTPTRVLSQTNKRFYTAEGLGEAATHLKPGGVFALWSDSEPESTFTRHLEKVFISVKAHLIQFDNPFTGRMSGNTVYLAQVK